MKKILIWSVCFFALCSTANAEVSPWLNTSWNENANVAAWGLSSISTDSISCEEGEDKIKKIFKNIISGDRHPIKVKMDTVKDTKKYRLSLDNDKFLYFTIKYDLINRFDKNGKPIQFKPSDVISIILVDGDYDDDGAEVIGKCN